jgi:hypothetical protein
MGCGCKNKGKENTNESTKTQSTKTQSVTESVKKVIEKYYIKK